MAGGLALALGLQSHAPPSSGLTVSVPPGPFAPGEAATITVTGDPGDPVLLLIDTELGGSILPFLGGIPIALGQSSNFKTAFRPNPTGTLQIVCILDCPNSAAFGTLFHVQAVSLDLDTREVCVSNTVSLSWEDDGSCTPEGCTPGYWMQPHHFDDWTAPYTPTTPFGSVFDDAFPGQTLADVVSSPQGGGLEILGFHTVAALLNAASPDVNYPLATQEVIDKFNAVFPGTTAEYLALKDEFESHNEAGCPLN